MVEVAADKENAGDSNNKRQTMLAEIAKKEKELFESSGEEDGQESEGTGESSSGEEEGVEIDFPRENV